MKFTNFFIKLLPGCCKCSQIQSSKIIDLSSSCQFICCFCGRMDSWNILLYHLPSYHSWIVFCCCCVGFLSSVYLSVSSLWIFIFIFKSSMHKKYWAFVWTIFLFSLSPLILLLLMYILYMFWNILIFPLRIRKLSPLLKVSYIFT